MISFKNFSDSSDRTNYIEIQFDPYFKTEDVIITFSYGYTPSFEELKFAIHSLSDRRALSFNVLPYKREVEEVECLKSIEPIVKFKCNDEFIAIKKNSRKIFSLSEKFTFKCLMLIVYDIENFCE